MVDFAAAVALAKHCLQHAVAVVEHARVALQVVLPLQLPGVHALEPNVQRLQLGIQHLVENQRPERVG